MGNSELQAQADRHVLIAQLKDSWRTHDEVGEFAILRRIESHLNDWLAAARAEGKAEGIREEREACEILIHEELVRAKRGYGDYADEALRHLLAAIRARGGK